MKASSVLFLLSMAVLVLGKKKNEALNRDSVPFWLQDIRDGLCLGPNGFGQCDVGSIWILAQTHPTKTDRTVIVSMLAPEAKRMCLSSSSGGMFSGRRPLGVSKCGRQEARMLGLVEATTKGHPRGYLLTQGGKNCLVRGQGRLQNSADMKACAEGTPLAVIETPIHSSGMQIATVDGYCFDGSRFRPCNDADPALRWGVGLDFRKSEPSRNLYAFYDEERCAVREGEVVKKGDCRSRGAGKWGWESGRLSQGGSHCLGRRQDNSALLVPCAEGFEHVTFMTPSVAPSGPFSSKHRGGGAGATRRGTPSSSSEEL